MVQRGIRAFTAFVFVFSSVNASAQESIITTGTTATTSSAIAPPEGTSTLETELPWRPPHINGLAGIYDYTLRNMQSYGSGNGNGGAIYSSTLGRPVKAETQSHVMGLRYELAKKWAFRVVESAADNQYVMQKNGLQRQVFIQGLGDMKTQAIYQIYEDDTHRFEASAGTTIPTGSTSLTGPDGQTLNPRMQLGSGTFDLIPEVSYTFTKHRWDLQDKIGATIHTGKGAGGYTMGDDYSDSASATYLLFAFLEPSFTVTLRNKQKMTTDHPKQNDPSQQRQINVSGALPGPSSAIDPNMVGPGWSYDGTAALRSQLPIPKRIPVRALVEVGTPVFQGGQKSDTGMKTTWFAGASITSNF